MSHPPFLLFPTILVFFWSSLASADTLSVTKAGADSGDCTASACLTISYAVDEASDDDTINIGAGTYEEQVTIDDKDLTLVGADRDTTIIDKNAQNDLLKVQGDSVVTLKNLTTSRGGNCIRVKNTADITLDNVLVRDCSRAAKGAGMRIDGDDNDILIKNSEFNDNSNTDADSCGGHIHTLGPLTIEKTSFINGSSAGNGGGICIKDTTANITGSSFSGNQAWGDGGAIHVRNATVTIDHDASDSTRTDFSDNLADEAAAEDDARGGAIFVTGEVSELTVNHSDFSDNLADDSGGSIYMSDETLNLDNSTFTGDGTTENAVDNGGAIAFVGGTHTIDDCVFTDVIAGTSGGVLEINTLAIVTITNSYFISDSSNTKATNGGAILVSGATANIIGSDFDDFYVDGAGGAILNANSSALDIDGCNFRDNRAAGGTNGGGAIFTQESSSLTIDDSLFSGNQATYAGGAIGQVSGLLTMGATTSNTFSNNAAATGGHFFGQGTLIDTGSSFTSGTTTSAGGAVRINSSGSGTFTDSTFTSNTAATSGGGIYFSSTGTLTLNNATFDGNNATVDRGGHLYMTSAANTLDINVGTSFSNGGAVNAGGIYVNSNTAVNIDQTTFSGITAAGDGGALYLEPGQTSLVLTSLTFTNNSADNGGAIYNDDGAAWKMDGHTFTANSATDGSGGAV
ncbi:MAG: hypothetical protein HN348_24280, partial [Proteobacteria bacterium]|nr:hypothetical protein [Pseudomonadota bacterium]